MHPGPTNTLTDVAGLRVGHATHRDRLTGTTVILCEEGAVAGVDVRGSAPGTRETALLDPVHLVERVHAVVLSGGSAFGLDAAGGVMEILAGRQVGFPVGAAGWCPLSPPPSSSIWAGGLLTSPRAGKTGRRRFRRPWLLLDGAPFPRGTWGRARARWPGV